MMRTPRRQRAYDMTDGRCTYCQTRLADDEALVPCGDDSLTLPEGSQYLCVTLKKPHAAGGRAVAGNEVPACHRCSALKGRTEHDAFLAKIGLDDGPVSGDLDDDTWVQLGEALSAAILGSLAPPTAFPRGVRTAPRYRSF